MERENKPENQDKAGSAGGQGTAENQNTAEETKRDTNLRPAGGRGIAGRLRRCNVILLGLSGLILMALCVLLLARIYQLNGTIDGLTIQREKLLGVIERQEAELTRLQQQAEKTEGQGSGEQDENSPENQDTVRDETPGSGEEEITAAHKVYLTFDDGPSIYTQDILDILARYDVKATFFIVGKENEAAKEAMKRIVEEGHTLAMHSYTHNYSDIYASVDNFAEDFARIQNYIYDVTGTKSMVYRFPGGSSNKVSQMDMAVFARYLDEQDVRFFDWNISSGDGGSYVFPVETLLENCTSKISNYRTSVILMHDSAGKKTTLEALPSVIEEILSMEDTVILPITEDTDLIQHIDWQEEEPEE